MTIKELIDNQKVGWSLHQRFYTDPDIYEAELDHIITKIWIMIGHVSEFSNTGDFKVFNMANESAIIVRSPDGNLKAFANVCRHRGSLVCLEQSGTIRKFSCPYHGWVYDLNGNLIQVRDMPDDFDKKDYGLHGLSLDIVHGLVFICFSDNPPSLESAKKELKDPMTDFDFENMKVAASKNVSNRSKLEIIH